MVQGGVPLAVEAIAAFTDNYIWALHDGRVAAVVDPGDAQPVLRFLQARGLALGAIVITHHHGDHVGGVQALVEAYPRDPSGAPLPVIGPADESIPCRTQAVREGDTVTLSHPAATFHVLDVPGHTRGHVAYVGRLQGPDAPASLFCGDTLFATGCGRLFEGTPAQMRLSLSKLAALPPDTRVYCAHEYTAANVRFARAVEPATPRWRHGKTKSPRCAPTGARPCRPRSAMSARPIPSCDRTSPPWRPRWRSMPVSESTIRWPFSRRCANGKTDFAEPARQKVR